MQIPSISIAGAQTPELRSSVSARQNATSGVADNSAANASSLQRDVAVSANSAAKKSESRPEDVDQAIENINKAVQAFSQKLEFSIDKYTDTFVVNVVDKETNEVIRHIPSEEFLNISNSLDKLQVLLIKDKSLKFSSSAV